MRTLIASLFAFAVLALFSSLPSANAADEQLRIRQLENEVMRLQRELDAQARRIDGLERSARGITQPSAPPSSVSRPADSSPAWLLTANWDRIRPGMKELDVIALLGRPTSVRTEDNGKVRALLYAMELGPNSVLAGNVRMGDAGVSEINKPTLR
jgi:hypothetical protein